MGKGINKGSRRIRKPRGVTGKVMVKAGSKKVYVKAEVEMRMENREKGRREKIVMIIFHLSR